ncbi:MAG: hypothetical protein ACI9IA_000973 [Enterobacterales bacterium]|jgi:uncharacterized protein with NRDE domain
MCILFLAINQHPDYPMIICANRDEFHQRPTQSAHYWQDKEGILAGRDLQAGGSWLGINRRGQFAAITNIRTGGKVLENKKSRGELVTFVLEENTSGEEHNKINESWLKEQGDSYSPFNLIYGNLEQLYCYNSVSGEQIKLSTGFHSISNGAMDEIWPKMAKGEQQLEQVVKSATGINEAALLSILNNQTRPVESELPNTGIPVEWEQLLSSIFICSENYGTRSSSIVLLGVDSSINFTEVEYDKEGNHQSLKRFNFSLHL